MTETVRNLGDRTTFKWNKSINIALDNLAKQRRQPKTVIVLEALAKTYPELREVINQERGWTSDSSVGY